MDMHLHMHLLEYVTKGHVATHIILFSILKGCILSILSGITVLNNIVLLITKGHLSIAQASSSFKYLDSPMYVHIHLTYLYN